MPPLPRMRRPAPSGSTRARSATAARKIRSPQRVKAALMTAGVPVPRPRAPFAWLSTVSIRVRAASSPRGPRQLAPELRRAGGEDRGGIEGPSAPRAQRAKPLDRRERPRQRPRRDAAPRARGPSQGARIVRGTVTRPSAAIPFRPAHVAARRERPVLPRDIGAVSGLQVVSAAPSMARRWFGFQRTSAVRAGPGGRFQAQPTPHGPLRTRRPKKVEKGPCPAAAVKTGAGPPQPMASIPGQGAFSAPDRSRMQAFERM